MNILSSGLYKTRIFHRRRRPKKHKLSYGAFFLLLDLDELDRLHRDLRWFSYNSFNLFSLFDRDHGPGANEALRPWVDKHLSKAGIDLAGGSVKMLCLPRILGYVFNPITVYYCYHANGDLRAVLYEVSNTFGQRHSYLFAVDESQGEVLRHSCAKKLYVSPFIDVTGDYGFSMKPPGRELYLHIRQSDADGPLLDAWMNGSKQYITDRALFACLFAYPLLTLKVIAGIHWEALQIWVKGMRVFDRPPAPVESVTIVQGGQDIDCNVAKETSL